VENTDGWSGRDTKLEWNIIEIEIEIEENRNRNRIEIEQK